MLQLRPEICWYSLALMRPVTVETAFDIIAPEACGGFEKRARRGDDIGFQMLEAKREGVSYAEVGKMFNCSKWAPFNQIKRYKKAHGIVEPDGRGRKKKSSIN